MTHRGGNREGWGLGCAGQATAGACILGGGQGWQECKALWDEVVPRFGKILAYMLSTLAQRKALTGATVCGLAQSAGLVRVPEPMPGESTLYLCWAWLSSAGRTVWKWDLRHDECVWEVKDSTGSHRCTVVWKHLGRHVHRSSTRPHHHKQGSLRSLWVPVLAPNEGNQNLWTFRFFSALKF